MLAPKVAVGELSVCGCLRPGSPAQLQGDDTRKAKAVQCERSGAGRDEEVKERMTFEIANDFHVTTAVNNRRGILLNRYSLDHLICLWKMTTIAVAHSKTLIIYIQSLRRLTTMLRVNAFSPQDTGMLLEER